jgi:hypothetical protein
MSEPVDTLVTAPFSVNVVDLKLTALTKALFFVSIFLIFYVLDLLSLQRYEKNLK